eukprot:jgi/Chrzof1/1700/Cz10g17220.t1
MSRLLADESRKFIFTFCDPQQVVDDFSGQLGKFTPCFVDIIILATGHLLALILYSIWLARGVYSKRPDKYRLVGVHKAVQITAIIASALCVLVPLFQLNARIGAQSLPLSTGNVAPHEVAGLLLAALSFLLLTIVLILELHAFAPEGRWILRLAVVLVAASELVKLRFVLVLDTQHNYFFWLYVVYAALQVYLAVLAMLWHPGKQGMELVQEGCRPGGYMVSVMSVSSNPLSTFVDK